MQQKVFSDWFLALPLVIDIFAQVHKCETVECTHKNRSPSKCLSEVDAIISRLTRRNTKLLIRIHECIDSLLLSFAVYIYTYILSALGKMKLELCYCINLKYVRLDPLVFVHFDVSSELIINLNLVLLNPDMSCLCKQCRSRSVGF